MSDLPIREEPAPQPPRPRPVRRFLLAVLVVVLVGIAWTWRQARVAPAWYAPPDPADGAVQEFAEKAEYRIVEELHTIREEDEPWDLIVPEAHLNAWFAARLPEWIEHERDVQWPEALGTPQLHMTDGAVDLALPVRVGSANRVITARVRPRVEAGRIALDVQDVGLGRMTIPGEPAAAVADLLERYASGTALDDEQARWLLALVRGEERLEGRIELSDGRVVEVLGVAVQEGVMRLRSRTVRQ